MWRWMVPSILLWLSASAAHSTPLPGAMVGVDWLAANRGDVVILDVRSDIDSFTLAPPTEAQRRIMAESLNLCDAGPPVAAGFRVVGHIEGSVLIPAPLLQSGSEGDGVERQRPSAESFARILREAGVDNESLLVISSQGSGYDDFTWAARLYWTLKYYGHDQVAILNGGVAAWQRAGLPLAHQPQSPEPGTFQVVEIREQLLATTGDVEAALSGDVVQLLDGRPLDEFSGRSKKGYVDGYGHLPGAFNLPPQRLNEAGRPAYLHSTDVLKALFRDNGIDPAAPTIAYCNSGRLAVAHWFILHELFGNREASLYDGSLHEWTRDPQRPLIKLP